MVLLNHLSLATASAAIAWGMATSTYAQFGPAVVQLEPATMVNVAATQQTVGTIMPTRRAAIGSAVDGRVVQFFVRQGDRVERDQPLAQLLTATIELELEAAKGELKRKEAELDELEKGLRDEEIQQAKAQMEASRFAAEFLVKERERITELDKTNAVSISKFEATISQMKIAEQRYQEAKAAYELAVKGTRPERLTQARADVAIREATVEKLADQLRKHTIITRFAGYVTVEHTEEGQWLSRGDLVAEIVALDQVDVLAKVVEADVSNLSLGDPVAVIIPALSNREFAGKVQSIVPQADVRSRTFPVKIRIENQFGANDQPLLKAGMLARASLPTEPPQAVLMVPKDALVLNGDQAMIWTVDSSTVQPAGDDQLMASAAAIPVTKGIEFDDKIEIRGEITEGTLVVTRGNERLRPSRPGMPPTQVTWQRSL